ncbi:hypothetical protein IFM89_006248 [Coptis chinensis]|uniref:Uncharacterized protein n=1 Tax=Coptis chinensis TaxID=261450 RepID=A0A835MBV0_9MAGN|nr:hypothetical protein IFM89_006248 [Coptis chinensis]
MILFRLTEITISPASAKKPSMRYGDIFSKVKTTTILAVIKGIKLKRGNPLSGATEKFGKDHQELLANGSVFVLQWMVLLWQPSYIQSLVGKAKVDIEPGQSFKKLSCSTVLSLAYQCLGVVYGDLSSSPLCLQDRLFRKVEPRKYMGCILLSFGP